ESRCEVRDVRRGADLVLVEDDVVTCCERLLRAGLAVQERRADDEAVDEAFGLELRPPVVRDGPRLVVFRVRRVLAVEDEVGGDVDEPRPASGGSDVAGAAEDHFRVCLHVRRVDDGVGGGQLGAGLRSWIAITSWPASTAWRQTSEPRYPAPPVTTSLTRTWPPQARPVPGTCTWFDAKASRSRHTHWAAMPKREPFDVRKA